MESCPFDQTPPKVDNTADSSSTFQTLKTWLKGDTTQQNDPFCGQNFSTELTPRKEEKNSPRHDSVFDRSENGKDDADKCNKPKDDGQDDTNGIQQNEADKSAVSIDSVTKTSEEGQETEKQKGSLRTKEDKEKDTSFFSFFSKKSSEEKEFEKSFRQTYKTVHTEQQKPARKQIIEERDKEWNAMREEYNEFFVWCRETLKHNKKQVGSLCESQESAHKDLIEEAKSSWKGIKEMEAKEKKTVQKSLRK